MKAPVAAAFIVGALAVPLASCSSNSVPSKSASVAFGDAISNMESTQDFHILVQSQTNGGLPESSDVVESPGGVHLKAVAGDTITESVIVGNRGWERSAATSGRWTELPDLRVTGTRRELNPSAEARCVRLEHGRLRSVGLRSFAKQKAWALSDDGSAPGSIRGTWYLTRSAPFRIIGFAGVGPAAPNAPTDCGSPGPGPIQRLYSYDVAPPVTVPIDVVMPPTPG